MEPIRTSRFEESGRRIEGDDDDAEDVGGAGGAAVDDDDEFVGRR